jgi:hypothetical protein
MASTPIDDQSNAPSSKHDAKNDENTSDLRSRSPKPPTERASAWVRNQTSGAEPELWQFAKGSNLSDAVINSQEPSKFWKHLETIGNPKRSRQIQLCDGVMLGDQVFDWTEKDNINALNQFRRQFIQLLGSRIARGTSTDGETL